MLESTPRNPYGRNVTDLFAVERNMRLRRRRLLAALSDDEIAPYMVNFPLLGVGRFAEPWEAPRGPVANSECIPDNVINPHPRFGTLSRNIRTRRGANVDIRLPLFRDTHTPEYSKGSALEPVVKMDAMAYGMGCCCLQVTFQARDLQESRYMYDQLAVLAPIMLAFSAAAPVFKGRLVDTDVRWSVIAESCDDRRPAERGEAVDLDEARDSTMVGDGIKRVYKSRYDSISRYLYTCNPTNANPCCPIAQGAIRSRHAVEKYNDVECAVDEEARDLLLASGLDDVMANHIAHLFARDPLVIFEGAVEEVDDEKSTEHFESIQSTNWQTVRWKPPPPVPEGSTRAIGWRVEFRSMEIQPTDFENAAFSVFIVLLTRAILAFDLALYVPLSLVDENMRRAHLRDACQSQKFWFRKNLAPLSAKEEVKEEAAESSQMENCAFSSGDAVEELTMDEIFNGKEGNFPGLIPLVRAYLESIDLAADDVSRLEKYLGFISDRAAGRLVTPATFIRRFVTGHPLYQNDSVVSEAIVYDLATAIDEIGRGVRHEESLLGSFEVSPVGREDPYETPLRSRRLSGAERDELLRRYTHRESFRTQEKRVETAISSAQVAVSG